MSNVIKLSNRKPETATARTVDITPTWSSLMPGMLAVLQNPKANPDAVQMIADELMRAADILDNHINKEEGEA